MLQPRCRIGKRKATADEQYATIHSTFHVVVVTAVDAFYDRLIDAHKALVGGNFLFTVDVLSTFTPFELVVLIGGRGCRVFHTRFEVRVAIFTFGLNQIGFVKRVFRIAFVPTQYSYFLVGS